MKDISDVCSVCPCCGHKSVFGVYSDLVTCELIAVSCPCGFRLDYPVFRHGDELEERLAKANPLELEASVGVGIGKSLAWERENGSRMRMSGKQQMAAAARELISLLKECPDRDYVDEVIQCVSDGEIYPCIDPEYMEDDNEQE